jgi:hypothetical protein
MLNPRIYRAAFLPVLLAVLVAAFSLQDRPRAIGTTLAPDAFDGARTSRALAELAERFPDRRPGSQGDRALAAEVERGLRAAVEPRGRDAVPGGERLVRTVTRSAQTIDGERDVTTVMATRPGQPGPGLVVVAHRDAAQGPARAELSGTAALLELARVTGDGRLRRTVTFVSTSGGSGGSAGAAAAIRELPRPVDAVLVLGDLASRDVAKPFVVGWSNGLGQAPLRLTRTVQAAVRRETGSEPGGSRASAQLVRLAFPVTLGEQGPLLAAGLPAVLLSASGERGPEAGAPVRQRLLEEFGRSALRAMFALDNGPPIAEGPEAYLVTQRKVLPGWAVRVLVASLLLPVWLAAIDGLARVRRRREPVGAGLRWVLAGALPFALAGAFTVLLALVGLLPAAPRALVPGGAIPAEGLAVGAVVLVFVLGWVLLRPVALRALDVRRPPATPAHAAAVLVVLASSTAVLWLRNPYAALLLVPAAHLWLLAVAPEVRLPRPASLGLVLLGLVPLGVAAAVLAGQLGLDAPEAAWAALLLVAGGHVGPAAWLGWSVLAGCGVAAALVAIRLRPDERLPQQVTVRGPLHYAGPGSLGGTKSALRR